MEWCPAKPKFKIDDLIWVQAKDGPKACRVLSYNAKIGGENDKLIVVLQSYSVSDYCVDTVHPKLAFSSKEEVERAFEIIPVKATDDQWFDAIGMRPETPRLEYDEDCDLGVCCATISNIRDFLAEAMRRGSLYRHEVEELQRLVDSHDKPGGDALTPILTQLGIKL